jgi:hypothetical protein
VAHYLFNVTEPARQVVDRLDAGLWGVAEGEPHRDALAPGDDALVYVASGQVLVARVEIGSAVRDWTAAEARAHPGDLTSGLALARVEPWEPPVPMAAVLAAMDPSERARAHFDAGVVRITDREHATALAVRAAR